jgi:hypothetical protein
MNIHFNITFAHPQKQCSGPDLGIFKQGFNTFLHKLFCFTGVFKLSVLNKLVCFDHSMSCSQVVNEENDLQIWNVAVNIFSYKLQIILQPNGMEGA